jgi:hypothetical protein
MATRVAVRLTTFHGGFGCAVLIFAGLNGVRFIARNHGYASISIPGVDLAAKATLRFAAIKRSSLC